MPWAAKNPTYDGSIPANSVLIRPYNNGTHKIGSATTPVLAPTSVWLFVRQNTVSKDNLLYVVIVGDNQKIGEVWTGIPSQTIPGSGAFNASNLHYKSTFKFPAGFSSAAASTVVQDSTGNFFVVRQWADTRKDLFGIPHPSVNRMEAYGIGFDDTKNELSITARQSSITFPVVADTHCGGAFSGYCVPEANGGSGIRVTKFGDLTWILGAAYSYLHWFDYITEAREIRR